MTRSISPPRVAGTDQRPRMRDETLLSLKEAASKLKSRISGKTASYYTVSRWAREGLRGERLETLRIGGAVFTSEEALDRFFARLGDRAEPAREDATPRTRTKRERDAASEEAGRILRMMDERRASASTRRRKAP